MQQLCEAVFAKLVNKNRTKTSHGFNKANDLFLLLHDSSLPTIFEAQALIIYEKTSLSIFCPGGVVCPGSSVQTEGIFCIRELDWPVISGYQLISDSGHDVY